MKIKTLFSAILLICAVLLCGCSEQTQIQEQEQESKQEEHIHEYGEWETTKAATCTENGAKERFCSCGDKQEQTVPALNHTWGDWTVTKESTCAEQGEKEQICSACGEKKTEKIELGKHNYGEWKIVKEPSCKEEGKREHICTVCGVKETGVIAKVGHSALFNEIDNAVKKGKEAEYSDMYTAYKALMDHYASSKCDVLNDYLFEYLCENMLYGYWEDASGNYISYIYAYENYDNTTGGTWYGTNLQTSKKSGNGYYYYTKIDGKNFVIGYEDDITEEKTDNFLITFNKDRITVKNKNDNKTYELKYNKTIAKTEKDNAKNAYVYFAKNILNFKYPNSVKVTQCYVNNENNETYEIYATVQASNGFGGTTNTKYWLYEIDGCYYIDEYTHNYTNTTNIDLDELNQKLSEFLASRGY